MSHLGERVTPLVDGELPADAAARAHAHLADCAGCRDAVEVQRQARSALQSAPDPQIPLGLLTALREMGGPQGPLPPPRDLVPAAFRPPLVTLPERPPRRRGTNGPPGRVAHRRPRTVRRRMALAVLGSFSLASAGVLTAVVLSGILPGTSTAPTAQLTFERKPATPWSQPVVSRSSASTVSRSLSSTSGAPPSGAPPSGAPSTGPPGSPTSGSTSSVSVPSGTSATSSPTAERTR